MLGSKIDFMNPHPTTIYSIQEQEEYSRHLKKSQKEFIDSWNEKSECTANLSQFELKTILGVGAFGVVWLVKHMDTDRFYAMKVMEKEVIVKQKQVEHSYNEKRVLCSINFPFLVFMKYFFKDNVYLYFVLPYISGGELFTYLRKMGKFEEHFSKFYSAQVVLAFEYLHACNLVYRDLKPENILIDKSGYLKITDFGFTKLITDRTWTLCGTPEYLAPEIILSIGYGKAVDWWSLGVLMFEMCAGYPPFCGSEPMKIYENIIACKYKLPHHFSTELKDLLAHTLQFETSKRYGNLKRGVMDFKTHEWFRDIQWNSLLRYQAQPPYIPKMESSCDTSHFDKYDDVKIKRSSICLHEEEFAIF